MSRMCRVVCLVLLFAFAVPTQAVPLDPPPKQESAFEKTRKALETSVSVDFQQVSLTGAIENLQAQIKVNMVLDRGTMNNIGILPEEMAMTLKLKDAKAKTVLRMLLAQANLSYYIEQDVVVITHEEIAIQRQVRQRVDVDVENIPLGKALTELQRQTGTNLVLDPRYAKKAADPVTMKLENVPLEVAVRLLAEMAGLRSVRQSNILFVTSKETAAELKKEEEIKNPFNPFFPQPGPIPLMGADGVQILPAMKGTAVPPLPPQEIPAQPNVPNPPMALPPPPAELPAVAPAPPPQPVPAPLPRP